MAFVKKIPFFTEEFHHHTVILRTLITFANRPLQSIFSYALPCPDNSSRTNIAVSSVNRLAMLRMTVSSGLQDKTPHTPAGDNRLEPALSTVIDKDASSCEQTRSRKKFQASRSALHDIHQGFKLWRLGTLLGWLDLKLQFRGSSVGPMWVTLSTLIMIGSMGLVYARLFHMNLQTYLPYLSISIILWRTGISDMLQNACTCFIAAGSSVRAMRLPWTVQIIRMLMRTTLSFGLTVIVPIGVYIWFGIVPGITALLVLPALFLWALNAFSCCMILGPLCARYRDVPPIISSAIQIAFYVTPVIWNASQLGARSRWLLLNPFYSLLEIVRGPLTGDLPSRSVWICAALISLTLWCIGFVTFARSRSRLAFWV